MHLKNKVFGYALNELIDQGCVNLQVHDNGSGNIQCRLAGKPSVVIWRTSRDGDLKLTVWLDYYHDRNPNGKKEKFKSAIPKSNKKSFYRFVGLIGSAVLYSGRFLDTSSNFNHARSGTLTTLNNYEDCKKNGFLFVSERRS